MAEPTKGSFNEPTALQHDEAFLVRLLFDNPVAHAVLVAPLLAALGREGAVQEGQTQARPHHLALIQRRRRVAILHVGRHNRESQDVASRIHQRHALAPDQLFRSVVASWATHPDALDALRVDDRQSRRAMAAAAATLLAGQASQLFIRWAHAGVWERLLDLAQERGVRLGLVFPDGTNIRAHQQAAGARRKGALGASEIIVRRLADHVAGMAPRLA